MKLHSIPTGDFKLDGGAMFGVVPKQLWERTNPADQLNLCNWSMRSMLIEDGDKLVLIDAGIGDKQDEKFFSHFHLHGDASLEKSLNQKGFSLDDITDVLLTHLHFDHCGGVVKWANEERTHAKPIFKNAKIWSNENHWDWATKPNPREKASFLAENINPIKESGQLNFIKREGTFTNNIFNNVDAFFADGHTESQIIPMINYKGKKIVFMADLLPSTGHIPLPYVMGYDTRPLLTMNEKELFLNKAADEGYFLFLEHDSVNEVCTVKHTPRGVRLDQTFKLEDIL